MNNKEFKVKKFKESTVYTLESATSGGTGNIATVAKPMGGVQRRTGDNFFTQEDADPIKPRRGPLRPQTGGGEHKDKTKTIPRKEKYRKPVDMSEDRKTVDMTGEKCTGCGKGTYQETSMHDDIDGVLHCTKCNKEVVRHQTIKPKKSSSVSEGKFEFDKKTGQMGYNTTDADQRHGLYINGKLVKTYNSREACDNVKQRDPKFKSATIKKIAESKEEEYGPEWQAMVKRVEQRAKEGPRKTVWDPVKQVYTTVPINPPKKKPDVAEGLPKDPNAPKKVQDRKTGKWYDPNEEFAKDIKDPKVIALLKRMAQKESVEEATGDKPFDQMLKGITSKTAVTKQRKIDRREEKKQNQERAKNAFGNMFGGPGAGIGNLSIRKGPPKDVAEGDEYNEYSDEVDMVKNNLLTIIRACKALAETMQSGENLPEWVEEKVSMSKQNMVTVAEYLQSQHDQGHVYDEDHSTANTGGYGKEAERAIYQSGALAGAGHDERMMEDEYMSELSSRLGEKLAKNAPVKTYIDDFAKAAKTPDAKGHHQFKNKSPEKVRQMAIAASYAAKNPSKKK